MKWNPWKITLIGLILQILATLVIVALTQLPGANFGLALLLVVDIIMIGIMGIITLLYLIKPIVKIISILSALLAILGFISMFTKGGIIFIIPAVTITIASIVAWKSNISKDK